MRMSVPGEILKRKGSVSYIHMNEGTSATLAAAVAMAPLSFGMAKV